MTPRLRGVIVLRPKHLSSSLTMPRRVPLPRLTVRLQPPDRTRLEEDASAAGLPPTTYAAGLIRAGLGAPFDLGGAFTASAAGIAEELRRCGVNLNQVARALNEARAVRDEEVLTAVAELIAAVEETRGLYLSTLRSTRENLRARVPKAGVGGRR